MRQKFLDTAAALALLAGLSSSGLMADSEQTNLKVNGETMTIAKGLAYKEAIKEVEGLAKVTVVEKTVEIIEDWSGFSSSIDVTISLEREGKRAPDVLKVGDQVDLVIKVPRYEDGLIAHVCLPDALARIVGGGQVKRFSLDFSGQAILRVPLAAVAPTIMPGTTLPSPQGVIGKVIDRVTGKASPVSPQHWAIIVRNMFREEQVGNPGLLEVRVI